MIVDGLEGNSRSGQPLADILGGTRRKRPTAGLSPATSTSDKSKAWRSQAYVRASMELLDAQYPAINQGPTRESRHRDFITSHRNLILTPSAEQSML